MAGPTNFGNGMLSGGGARGATDRARSIDKTFNLTTNGQRMAVTAATMDKNMCVQDDNKS